MMFNGTYIQYEVYIDDIHDETPGMYYEDLNEALKYAKNLSKKVKDKKVVINKLTREEFLYFRNGK